MSPPVGAATLELVQDHDGEGHPDTRLTIETIQGEHWLTMLDVPTGDELSVHMTPERALTLAANLVEWATFRVKEEQRATLTEVAAVLFGVQRAATEPPVEGSAEG